MLIVDSVSWFAQQVRLTEKGHQNEIQMALSNPNKMVVIQYAPAISVSIAETFGMEPGKDINGIMNAALRKMGFDKVFDTTFSADGTITEESAELSSVSAPTAFYR